MSKNNYTGARRVFAICAISMLVASAAVVAATPYAPGAFTYFTAGVLTAFGIVIGLGALDWSTPEKDEE